MRDLIGANIVKGIGVGVDIETPNLQKNIDDDLKSLTTKMKATVDFETAKTSANIISSSNYKVGMEPVKNNGDNSTDGIPNGSVFILKNDMDGQNIGEKVYKVVNNKLALATKRAR
jgi:hypothetical protein